MHAATQDLEDASHTQEGALVAQTVRSSRKRVIATVAAGVLAVSALCAGTFVAKSAFAVASPNGITSRVGTHTGRVLAEDKGLVYDDGQHVERSLEEARALRAGLNVNIYNPSEYGSPTDAMAKRTGQLGTEYHGQLVYQPVYSLSYQFQVKPYQDAGKEVTQVVTFNGLTTQAIGSGIVDGLLKAFATDAGKDGRTLYIRIMHEMNGDWYTYGSANNHDGNTPESFKSAFRHVVGVMRPVCSNCKFQLSYNCQTPGDQTSAVGNTSPSRTDMNQWFPGADVVDMVLCSAYNRAGVNGASFQTFADAFHDGYFGMDAIGGAKGLPLGVAETSSTSGFTDGQNQKAVWFTKAVNSLLGDFPRVTQASFFLWNVDDGDASGDYDVNTDAQGKALGNGIKGTSR